MATKIHVQDLRPGMMVIDSGLSWIDNPRLYSTPGVIKSEEQVRSIFSDGYHYVFIEAEENFQIALGLGNANHGTNAAPSQEANLKESLIEASELQTRHIHFSKKIIQNFSSGKSVNYNEAASLVADTMKALNSNKDALLGVAKLKVHDPYTYTHSVNVAIFSIAFGSFMKLKEQQVLDIGLAAMFHDVGKVVIPQYILNKAGKLTEHEFSIIKTHTTAGVPALEKVTGLSDSVIAGVVSHHEKFDGLGYPDGLSSENINLYARIILLADVYDALTSRRVYKAPMMPHKALGIMYGMRGKDFFPELVESFIRCVGVYPSGSVVKLNDGRIGVVTRQNAEQPTKPDVVILRDKNGIACKPMQIDLNIPSLEDKQQGFIIECVPQGNVNLDINQLCSQLSDQVT